MSDVPQVDVRALEAALSDGAYLLDVREPDEWLEARVEGGVLIPLATVADHVTDIPVDRPVYVICRSGGRSEQAAAWLRTQDIDARNVTGGTLAWQAADLPVSAGPTT